VVVRDEFGSFVAVECRRQTRRSYWRKTFRPVSSLPAGDGRATPTTLAPAPNLPSPHRRRRRRPPGKACVVPPAVAMTLPARLERDAGVSRPAAVLPGCELGAGNDGRRGGASGLDGGVAVGRRRQWPCAGGSDPPRRRDLDGLDGPNLGSTGHN
jgi:hypothetical protein